MKLEGGIAVAPLIERLASFDIPVMGHVGLTPQSYHRMGGHKVQGKTHSEKGELVSGSWERVIADAVAVQDAGAFSVVLEGVPTDLAEEITKQLTIPTIGIGAGAGCDGQILVSYDMLGLGSGGYPKFVKQFAAIGHAVTEAVAAYKEEVQCGGCPAPANRLCGPNRKKVALGR